jgi:hypothetical protein
VAFDKLLDIAEKGDVSQLSQVSVAGKTGSPSLDMPVSSVERQASTVGQTPAAVFVITNEMIAAGRRLFPPPMVPGMQVAHFIRQWAVSEGIQFAIFNKLLVQIDRRTVYDLFFGGVIWDVKT